MSEVLGGYGEFEVFGHDGKSRGTQVGEIGSGNGDDLGIGGDEGYGTVGVTAIEEAGVGLCGFGFGNVLNELGSDVARGG